MDRDATIAGTTAMRFATSNTPVIKRAMSQISTTETGTAPGLFANACHTTRRTNTPGGMHHNAPYGHRGSLPGHDGGDLAVHASDHLQ